MQRYIFILLLLPLSWLLHAQPLEVLQQEVEQNNPSLQALRQAYLAAQERIPQVGQLPQPQVGVSTFPLPVETRLGAQQLRVGASQSFPWFGTLEQRKAVESTKAQRIQEEINLQRQELFAQLDHAYVTLYQLEEERRISAAQLELLAAREQLALAKVENGQGAIADVLRIQLKEEELRQRLQVLERSQATPQAVINQLRHQPANQPISTMDHMTFTVLPWSKEALLQQLKQSHPMLRSYALEQQITQQELQLSQLQQKPSFQLGLDYIAVAEREDAVIDNNGRDILQLRASVVVPIYRQAYQAREREQERQLQRIQYQESAMLDQLATVVEHAYTEHATARLEMGSGPACRIASRSTVRDSDSAELAGRSFIKLREPAGSTRSLDSREATGRPRPRRPDHRRRPSAG